MAGHKHDPRQRERVVRRRAQDASELMRLEGESQRKETDAERERPEDEVARDGRQRQHSRPDRHGRVCVCVRSESFRVWCGCASTRAASRAAGDCRKREGEERRRIGCERASEKPLARSRARLAALARSVVDGRAVRHPARHTAPRRWASRARDWLVLAWKITFEPQGSLHLRVALSPGVRRRLRLTDEVLISAHDARSHTRSRRGLCEGQNQSLYKESWK